MKDPAYVRRVNAHPKGTCARKDLQFPFHPKPLPTLFFFGRKSRVIRCPSNSRRHHPLSPPFTFMTRLNVHQALISALKDVVQKGRIAVTPTRNFKPQIGPPHGSPVNDHTWRHLICDVMEDVGSRCGGKCPPNGLGIEPF